jgi:signal peptidase I
MPVLAALVATVLVAVAGTAAVVWLRQRFVLVTVQGISMQPTFQSGDRVLVRRTPLSGIHPGAIVVLDQPITGLVSEGFVQNRATDGRGLDRNWMIKRAVALPGTPVPEELAAALDETPGALVPPGRLAILGDNPNHSYDSRVCGYITEAQVLGVAVRVVSRATQQLRQPRPEPGVADAGTFYEQ